MKGLEEMGSIEYEMQNSAEIDHLSILPLRVPFWNEHRQGSGWSVRAREPKMDVLQV